MRAFREEAITLPVMEWHFGEPTFRAIFVGNIKNGIGRRTKGFDLIVKAGVGGPSVELNQATDIWVILFNNRLELREDTPLHGHGLECVAEYFSGMVTETPVNPRRIAKV
jgi:hypothetical protein